MIVGNKADIEDERAVTRSEGQEFANKYGASFFETSAKTRLNVGKRKEKKRKTFFLIKTF